MREGIKNNNIVVARTKSHPLVAALNMEYFTIELS